MLRARIGEQQRLRGGIVAIDGRTIHIAFGQAHDLSTLQVDGGKNDDAHGAMLMGQGFQSRKRERKERP